MTETATGNVFADMVFNFVDSSAENLVERILPFDSELIGKQLKLVFYKKKNIQTFKVTENRPHNISYPQAGLWWLVDRKFEFKKAAHR